MLKLIASDLDGTLLQNGSQTLPEGICDQIRRLKEKGILFVAASGRPVCQSKTIVCTGTG